MIAHFVFNAKRLVNYNDLFNEKIIESYLISGNYNKDCSSLFSLNLKTNQICHVISEDHEHPFNLIKNELIPTLYPERYNVTLIPSIESALREISLQKLEDAEIHIRITGEEFYFIGLNLDK